INDRYITCNIDSYITFFFFLTSRRLHTRSKRDWSSDVCSSDLLDLPGGVGIEGRPQREREGGDAEGLLPQIDRGVRGPSPQLEQDGFELGTPCGELETVAAAGGPSRRLCTTPASVSSLRRLPRMFVLIPGRASRRSE